MVRSWCMFKKKTLFSPSSLEILQKEGVGCQDCQESFCVSKITRENPVQEQELTELTSQDLFQLYFL